MWQTFLLILLTLTFFGEFINGKSVKRQDVKDTSLPLRPYDLTIFDTDYDIQPRGWTSFLKYQQKSNPTTTQRPLMSYWQNIVRNVRLPMPSITWNVTNPLANLFPIENLPTDDTYQTEEYYNSSSQRRHKDKRRRKNHHNKRNKKRKNPVENVTEIQQQQIIVPEENQIVLTQYPQNEIDSNQPMYFYDPNTDEYYAIQRIRALGSFIEGGTFNPKYSIPFVANEQNVDITDNSPIANVDLTNDDNSDEDDDDIESDINLDEAVEIDLDKVTNLKEQKKQEESLRNALGAYMLDDHFNLQRQRAQDKRKKSHVVKQHPRDYFKYLFLLDNH